MCDLNWCELCQPKYFVQYYFWKKYDFFDLFDKRFESPQLFNEEQTIIFTKLECNIKREKEKENKRTKN